MGAATVAAPFEFRLSFTAGLMDFSILCPCVSIRLSYYKSVNIAVRVLF